MRYYSSTASAVDLTGSISNSATAITVSSTTGFPGTTPYTLVLDPDQATEEIVEVTNVSGLTLTITRAVDGSSAQAHSAGVANVQHMATARDYREPQDHIAASTNVHGLAGGAAVVGDTTVQTLKNKTAQAASAATVGLIAKGTASQTASYFEVQDSTGGVVAKVTPGVGTLTVGNAQINGTGADNLFGFLARFTSSGAGVVAGIFKRIAGQTADIVQVQDESGAMLAKFDASGNLTAPAVTAAGAVSGATGTFAGAVSTGALSSSTGAFSGTVSSLDHTVTGNVAASGNVTGANLTATSTKAGKKLHWDKITTGVTDASGYVNVTHGAGFTPRAVTVTAADTTFASNHADCTLTTDTYGATTFRLRAVKAGVGAVVGQAYTISYTCGE